MTCACNPYGESGLVVRSANCPIHGTANGNPLSKPNASPEAKKPRFSILHTSARPDKWREIYDAWLAAADRPEDVEYVLVVDERWGFVRQLGRSGEDPMPLLEAGKQRGDRDICVWNTGRRCYVEGVNLAAKHSTGDILIVIADDQYPCEHWDTELRSVAPFDGKTRDYVLHVATGTPDEFARQITPMPIMSRKLYEKWGYVFYPGYESMFADNDCCEHAKADGVLIEARYLFFPHKHPLCDPGNHLAASLGMGDDIAGWDEAYQAQNSSQAFEAGEKLLTQRRKTNFGNLKKQGKKTLAVCLPGETFSHEWVTAWTATHAWLSQHFALLPPFFGYSSNPHITRAALLNNVFSACANGVVPDYILWIDDDNPVEPIHLKQLFEDLEEHQDIDVIAAWCWMKDGKRISAGNFADDGSSRPLPFERLMSGPHDIWRVAWTGFPCVIVKSEVFMKVQNPFAMMECSIWPGFYGEDMAFSRRATAAGFMIAVDRRVRVPHLKLGDIPDPKNESTDAAQSAPEATYQGEYL
jgi:hypothetical protein